ncbi:hypothetical protein LCGC14_2373570, partial [marine sediment metagenome]
MVQEKNFDGKDIAEFRANAFIINPDYPNYNIPGSIDESLVTYPDDLTVVQWQSHFVQVIEDAGDALLKTVRSVVKALADIEGMR